MSHVVKPVHYLLTPMTELSRYGTAVNMMSFLLAPRLLAMYVGSHCMMI